MSEENAKAEQEEPKDVAAEGAETEAPEEKEELIGGVKKQPTAQDPPNGLFWAQKWSKTVLPKNDPACFGKVYGAYSDRLGPISGLFWLGFRPPLAPKRRLVRSNSAGQQARTHAGEGCRLADNIMR